MYKSMHSGSHKMVSWTELLATGIRWGSKEKRTFDNNELYYVRRWRTFRKYE